MMQQINIHQNNLTCDTCIKNVTDSYVKLPPWYEYVQGDESRCLSLLCHYCGTTLTTTHGKEGCDDCQPITF